MNLLIRNAAGVPTPFENNDSFSKVWNSSPLPLFPFLLTV